MSMPWLGPGMTFVSLFSSLFSLTQLVSAFLEWRVLYDAQPTYLGSISV